MAACRETLKSVVISIRLLFPLVFVLFVDLWMVQAATELPAAVVDALEKFTLDRSPYVVRGDLVIERTGVLEIEAGVEMQFMPGIGMTVRGKLAAQGTEYQRIRMTRAQPGPADGVPVAPDIRLVDGPTPFEGRLQISYKGRWRSVCTNSKNWTLTDFRTACRQLGFSGGTYSRWYNKDNDTFRILYEAPGCDNSTSSLLSCVNWAGYKMGAGVCELHPDMGVRCEGRPPAEYQMSNWRGLFFDNALSIPVLLLAGTVNQTVSQSVLSNIDVWYAGYNASGFLGAAIEVFGVPPNLDGVTVKWSALNGVNITEPGADITIRKCEIVNNRGHGLVINSTVGGAHVYQSTMSGNGGDGVHYNKHTPREPLFGATVKDFCRSPSEGIGQVYPVRVTFQQTQGTKTNTPCQKEFLVNNLRGQILTLHVVTMMTTAVEGDGGTVQVRDGRYSNSPLLAFFPINNYTFPASVASTGNALWVQVTARASRYVAVSIVVDAGLGRAYDLNVSQSSVIGNGGRGVAAEDSRSTVHVTGSQVGENGYAAGIHVTGERGSGDVNVTTSNVSGNAGDGVRVTYNGGRRNISQTILSRNSLRGVYVWINTTASRPVTEREHTVLHRSRLEKNLREGLLVANYCGPALNNVSESEFIGMGLSGVRIHTCLVEIENSSAPVTTIRVTNSKFDGNSLPGVQVTPVVNSYVYVAYNIFTNHPRGALVIRSGNSESGDSPDEDGDGADDDALASLPAKVLIERNTLNQNSGTFIASIGVSERGADRQQVTFSRNILRGNRVTEAYPGLVSRRRTAAVVTVGSTNAVVTRNRLENPLSHYEIASQAPGPYKIIDATFCFFGGHANVLTDSREFNARIFDSKHRADLAKINFMPYLLVPDLDNDVNASPNVSSLLVNNFYNGSDVLGGVVYGNDNLPSGIYTVTQDIFIPEKSVLDLKENTELRFLPSTGLYVQGTINVHGGTAELPVIFTQKDNQFSQSVTGEPSRNVAAVRLVGGSVGADVRDGRVEVLVDGRWGTVCARARWGWDITAASIACQAMGLVVNPADWWPLPFGVPAGEEVPVLLGHIRCTPFDTEIGTCESDKNPGDLENACNHGDDVYLRCYRQAWSGIYFGPLAGQSRLNGVRIEKAGVVDYSTRLFGAGLRVAIQRHSIVDSRVAGNLDTGLAVTFNDLHSEEGPRRMERLIVEGNRRDGILTRTCGIHINDTRTQRNGHSGVKYDPAIPRTDRRDLTRWVDPGSSRVITVTPGKALSHRLARWESVFVVLDASSAQSGVTNGTVVVDTDPDNALGVQVIAPLEGESVSERAEVLDGNPGQVGVAQTWNLRDDLIVFPTVTSTTQLTVNYFRKLRHNLGNAVLYVTALERRLDWPSVAGPTPTLKLTHSVISLNAVGVSTAHFEWGSGERGERFLRTLNESLELVHCVVSDNSRAAIYVDVAAGEPRTSPRANVTYTVNDTEIVRNGAGVEQLGRDSHGGHTLLHWIIANTVFMFNTGGGFRISPPYVDPYDARNSHSVRMFRVRFKNNTDFAAQIAGHYARVLIDRTQFSENRCRTGLIGFRGTEKEIDIRDSEFDSNLCAYVLDFAAESHADAVGFVGAIFRRNSVRYNVYDDSLATVGAAGFGGSGYGPRSYGVGVRGVQRVDVIRNLLGSNKMDFELLSGVPTSTLDVSLNATENWWGTVSAVDIVSRMIFDFDDWNAYSPVAYSPYLRSEDFGSEPHYGTANTTYMSTENLGGRLYGDLYLFRRPYPYVVRSDLTIMPGAKLTVEPGALMQFYPGVGILVLGTLRAQGNEYIRTKMEPYVTQGSSASTGGGDPDWLWRKNKDKLQQGAGNSAKGPNVRLCFEKVCGSDYNKDGNQGFLEVRNLTTGQWVPVCDPYFTERNAEVVCRELGHRRLGAIVTWGARWDLDLDILSRVTHWPWPRICTGGEPMLSECVVRHLGPHPPDLSCPWNSKTFAYIRCEPFAADIPEDAYWGGVRFAAPSYEPKANFWTTYTGVNSPRGTVQLTDSVLEYVDLIGGGVLHGQRAPALGLVRTAPLTLNVVNVTSSAWHGVGIIAPQGDVYLQECRVEKNLGVGINLLVLQGETRDNSQSSFSPLEFAALTYNEFGMVSMCTAEKELMVSERVLVYYKYSSSMAECVKVFRSADGLKPLGLRLLQMNLYDGPSASEDSDRLRVLDGDLYGLLEPKVVADIYPDAGDSRTFYKTRTPSMTLNVRASGASESFGFIVEVTTLPSTPTIDRDRKHNISYSQIRDNLLGGLTYANTGENGPTLTVIQNQWTGNGVSLYGNLSTSYYAVGIDVQNTMHLYFQNNLLLRNQGGLWVRADSETASGSLQALVTNNVFSENSKWESLSMVARRASTYQSVEAARNIFSLNPVPYRDVISFRQLVSTFTYNMVYNNTGSHVLMVEGFPQSSQPKYQVTTHNVICDNRATWLEERGTILMATPGQRLEENILLNPSNDFELMTGNLTSSASPVDATNNWWGYNQTTAVQARIRDGRDRPDLVSVEFEPFYMNNYTLVSGWCPAGWRNVTMTCLLYVGGVFEFEQAMDYCTSIGGTVPYIDERNLADIRGFVAQNQPNYNPYFGIWVRSLNAPISGCTAFYWDHNHETKCETRLPTICERNPDVYPDTAFWARYKVTIAAVGAVAGALLLVILCVACWLWKSRRRHREKLERRNSIRSSIRSNSSLRFAGSTASSVAFTGSLDLAERRKMHSNGTKKDVKLTEVKRSEVSLDSITKPSSRFGSSTINSSVEDDRSYEVFEAKNHHFDYSDYDDGTETEAATLPRGYATAVSPEVTSPDPPHYHYGFPGGNFSNLSKSASGDNSQLWGSSTGTEDTLEVKRGFGSTPNGGNGAQNNGFHSTHSLATSNGSGRHPNLLETDF